MLISVKPAYVARLTAQPDTSQAALAALRADMSAFYQREMQCGDRCKAYIVERSPGVFLLSVHVKDLPMVRLEFEGDELMRHVGNPNIHSVVESSAVTVGLFYLPQSMGLPCFGSEALHPLPAGSDLTKGPSGQRCEGEKISFSGRLAFDALAMPVRPIRADTRTALWKAPPEAVLPLYRVVLVAFHYSCPRCHEKTACQGTHQL